MKFIKISISIVGLFLLTLSIYFSLDSTKIKYQIVDDINLKSDEHDAYLKIDVRHLNEYDPKTWVIPSNYSLNSSQTELLDEIGLIRKDLNNSNGRPHKYSLTAMGASKLLNIKNHSGFYFGQLSFSGIQSIEKVEHTQLLDEEVFLVVPKFKVLNIEEWVQNPRIEKLFPEIESVTSPEGKKYIFIKSKHAGTEYQNLKKHVEREIYKKYSRKEKFRIRFIGPAFRLKWLSDKHYLLAQVDRFIPYTRKRVEKKIKEKGFSGLSHGSEVVLTNTIHIRDVFPYVHCKYKFVGTSNENSDELVLYSFDMRYIKLKNMLLSGHGSPSKSISKSENPEAYALLDEIRSTSRSF